MSDNHPLVSVIVPCYNHQAYIQDCIQSIIDQSYHPIELIIIDDGSKDQSVNKIQELVNLCQTRFIRFEFRVRPNKGLSATLNEGLTWIKGDYFCVIASDDMMAKDKTQIQIDYAIKHPQVTSIYGGVQHIDEQGNLKQIKVGDFKAYSFEEIFLQKFSLYAPTQMHKRDEFMQLGGFSEATRVEDWEMLLRLTHENKIVVCLPDLLAYYRVHGSNTFSNHALMLVELLKISEQYKNHSLFKSAQFNIIKVNKLKPMKKMSKLNYYLLKIIYFFKYKMF
jgi:alpha-1,3-rhamnosyltransferase